MLWRYTFMKLLLTFPYVVLAVLLVAFTILLKLLYLTFIWLPCFLEPYFTVLGSIFAEMCYETNTNISIPLVFPATANHTNFMHSAPDYWIHSCVGCRSYLWCNMGSRSSTKYYI